jgi:hypothetical protein
MHRQTRSKNMNKRIVAAALGAAVLAVPGVAAAKSDHGQGKGQDKASTVKSHSHAGTGKSHAKKPKAAKTVMYVFKGVYKGAGVVTVAKGNHHAKEAGYVGKDVTFDLSAAKLVVADTDGVAGITADDVQVGDKVVVQARLARVAKTSKKHSKGSGHGDAAGSDDSTSTSDTTTSTDTTTTTDAPAAIKARKLVDQTHPAAKAGDSPDQGQEPSNGDAPASAPAA